MELGEIIKDAIKYPTSNIKALVLYIVLGFVIGIIEVLTGTAGLTSGTVKFQSGPILGAIGIILVLCISFLMFGFSTDVIKFSIERRPDAPEIDFARQVMNGIKYIIVCVVYMIVPIIVMVILAVIFQSWLATILGLIVAVIFAFVLAMGICRLAKTDSLGYALDVKGAIGDLQTIGIGKVIITLVVATIVGFVIIFALSYLLGIILAIASQGLIGIVVAIFAAIFDAWLLFYENRVMGLLYSDIA